jgi:redox-sensitive bicupin YhaK (pirin superfamily)
MTSDIETQQQPRKVTGVVPAVRTVEGGGFVVRRAFPTGRLDMADPFLLLDHMGPVDYGPGEAVGAPDHPHRGFETVTYVLDGDWEHADSAGNSGFLRPGSVQWMTAGSGVVHSEMPAASVQRDGGRVHGLQLWVNLPRADKMTPPRYQDIDADEIPDVEPLPGVRARVVAGEMFGTRGPVQTHSPIVYVHVTQQPGTSVDVPIPDGEQALAYVIAGSVRVGESGTAPEASLVVFEGTEGAVHLEAPDDNEAPTDVLVIAGTPLREPVARYGPFVMNTKDEIIEAFEDYQSGRMGQIA